MGESVESALSALAAILLALFCNKPSKWLLLDLSLSLSGSLWLSVTPTLALTGSHCHSLAYSGPLWLTIAL